MERGKTFRTFWGTNVLNNDMEGVQIVDWDNETDHGHTFKLVSGGVPLIHVNNGVFGVTTTARYRITDGNTTEEMTVFIEIPPETVAVPEPSWESELPVPECAVLGCIDHLTLNVGQLFKTFWGQSVLDNDAPGVTLLDWDFQTADGHLFNLVSNGVPQVYVNNDVTGVTTTANYRVTDGTDIDELTVFIEIPAESTSFPDPNAPDCSTLGCNDSVGLDPGQTFKTFWGENVLSNDVVGTTLVDWDMQTSNGHAFDLVSGGVPQVFVNNGVFGVTTTAKYRVSDGLIVDEITIFIEIPPNGNGDDREPLSDTPPLPPNPPDVELRACLDTPDCWRIAPNGSPLQLKAAFAQLPKTGAELRLEPGEYPVSKDGFLWIANFKWLKLVGIPDVNGKRPIIRGIDQDYPNNLFFWQPTNGDLTIQGVEFTGAGSNCIAAGSSIGSNQQTIRLENIYAHHCSHHIVMIGFEKDGARDDEVYITDSEFSNSGSTHVVYVDNVARFDFIRSSAHSPASLHALKAIAFVTNIIDSSISNVQPDGTPDADTSSPFFRANQPNYIGSATISLVACQRGVVRGNHIIHYYAPARSGPYAVTRQPRHDLEGCNEPPYFPTPQGQTDLNTVLTGPSKFWDRAFWANVVAGGLSLPTAATNPEIVAMWWSDNHIELIAPDNAPTTMGAIANYGSYPNQQKALGSSQVVPIAAPDGWVERSRDYLINNCVTGYRPGQVMLSPNPPFMVGKNGQPVNPSIRIFETGPNDCNQTALVPPWFQTNLMQH